MRMRGVVPPVFLRTTQPRDFALSKNSPGFKACKGLMGGRKVFEVAHDRNEIGLVSPLVGGYLVLGWIPCSILPAQSSLVKERPLDVE